MAVVTGLNGDDRRCSMGWNVEARPAFMTIDLYRAYDGVRIVIALTGEEWQAIHRATKGNTNAPSD